MKFRLSNPAVEGHLNVSKWLKFQVLLSAEEMKDLFQTLPDCSLYNVSEVVDSEGMELSSSDFIKGYTEYVERLKQGECADEKRFRRLFSKALSVTSDIFYAHEVKPHHYLVKPVVPIIQMQLHHFLASEIDGKYYPMNLGQESVSWGVQFSYPQIYQDPLGHSFSKVTESSLFPNTALFRSLTRWLRNFSFPTTFIWKEQVVAVPMRIGKQVLPWIHAHAQLKKKGISVHVY
jgi:hypothetical protein